MYCLRNHHLFLLLSQVIYFQVSLAWIDDLRAQGLLGSYFAVPNKSIAYDYIIVGGGTAGLALSHRLSTNFRLLLSNSVGSTNSIMVMGAKSQGYGTQISGVLHRMSIL